MNIFKVLASGRAPFQEEQASTIIAWLLNPRMEHGLGYVFLSRFVQAISVNNEALLEISNSLSPRLRSSDQSEVDWACFLEYNVQSAFIDIVLRIDDWVLAVENKIYSASASDPKQLQREYDGIKKHPDCKDKKIGMIFLVPADLDPRVELEYSNLTVKNPDFKCLITWQPVPDNASGYPPSISELIVNILEDESKGNIEPIPEYTRHTLKAFNQFINNNFSGYDFQPVSSSGGLNPLTEKIYNIDKLKRLDKGYVGVKGGFSGLLQMSKTKLQNHNFQYTTADMSAKNQWIQIDTFNKIVDWLLYGKVSDIDWEAKLSSALLFKISQDFGDRVYIGIRGGQKALSEMDFKRIKEGQWKISKTKGSSNWIEGTTFCKILEQKGYS